MIVLVSVLSKVSNLFSAYLATLFQGRKWFNSFMLRNPRLSIRTPEEVSSASARVTEYDIRNWFTEVHKWLVHHGMDDVLIDPSRVFNGDETSFYLHPKTKEVIAQRGSRNVYEVEQACGKQNVTVMFSFSATGSVVNPLIILPGQRIRKEIAQGFPPEWGIGQSERGWMTTHNFSEYVKKIFHPFLLREGIKLPVIFFVDGHSSHVGVEVADLCQQLGIILIALYPNTTRITQPADVSIFKPLKDQWKQEVDDWRTAHPGYNFTLRYFGGVLEKAVARGIKTDSIINGFRVCGLFPFDANNVDYTKCIAKPTTNCVPAAVGLSMDTFSPGIDSTPAKVSGKTQESTQSVTGCAEDPVREISSTVGPRLSIDSNDSLANVKAPFTVFSDYVPIHKDKIKKAVEMIGIPMLTKIQKRSGVDLSHEERVIQYFYKDFIQPFTTFDNNSFNLVDNRNEQHTMIEVGENDKVIGELLIDNEGNVTIFSAKETTQQEVINLLNEPSARDHLTNPEAKSAIKSNSTSNNSVTTISVCCGKSILVGIRVLNYF
ncbi:uncharacterized protein LOC135705888 [Ochlerotatus camptorhynchus]|uniref:uncharacterized protein LOC135705888 n=1 Tax=Ochlerotatus camptorhynchus TaxID=644619 RepID=UPI0031D75799